MTRFVLATTLITVCPSMKQEMGTLLCNLGQNVSDMERPGSRVKCIVTVRKKIDTWYPRTLRLLLFSLDNFQMCVGQTNQKDEFLFTSAPFTLLETGTLATQIHVGGRTQAELQNLFVSIVSAIFSVFSMSFHATCKETSFPFGLQDSNTMAPAPFLQPPLFPTTFLYLQRTWADSWQSFSSSEFILSIL